MKIKNPLSTFAIFLLLLISIVISSIKFSNTKLIVTTSDAFGYYMYLPSTFIYKDFKKLEWKDEIDKKYNVFGGNFYHARLRDRGYVNKYYCGVSLLQSPFFLLAHWITPLTNYPQDGFSFPYQFAILIASILYFFIGIVLLSKIINFYFDDIFGAITLLSIGLATNILQYVSIEAGLSHSYLFFIYSLIIYSTYQWHKKPNKINSAFVGFVIGIAICCRPTEAIAILIPILWEFDYNEQTKWKYLRDNPSLLFYALIFGTLALLPQFVYWLHTTGNLIYDVGSKWSFLNPFFRVLFGGEKGWFVYTPITLIFIFSLFYIRRYKFSKAFIYFTIFNIWIVISWFDWRYGGSYSTRALSHSLPVFALPFAALIKYLKQTYAKLIMYSLLSFLSVTNLFQIYQYNKGVIHYDHMNFKYYKSIYWNLNPSCLEFSLLDTKDWHDNYSTIYTLIHKELKNNNFKPNDNKVLIKIDSLNFNKVRNLKNEISTIVNSGIWGASIITTLSQNNKIFKEQKIRLKHPDSKEKVISCYSYFTDIPSQCNNCTLTIKVEQKSKIQLSSTLITVESIRIPN